MHSHTPHPVHTPSTHIRRQRSRDRKRHTSRVDGINGSMDGGGDLPRQPTTVRYCFIVWYCKTVKCYKIVLYKIVLCTSHISVTAILKFRTVGANTSQPNRIDLTNVVFSPASPSPISSPIPSPGPDHRFNTSALFARRCTHHQRPSTRGGPS